MLLHTLVDAISSQIVGPGAKVSTSANYHSLDCKELRFGDEAVGWTMSHKGVTVSVTFKHKKRRRTDVLMIEHRVDKLAKTLPDLESGYKW